MLFETGCQGGRGGTIVGYGLTQCSDRMWTVFYVFHRIYRNNITFTVFPVNIECKRIYNSNLLFF